LALRIEGEMNEMPMDVDYVIIGGGIAGCSLAYELSFHGTVAILEREEFVGYHTTGRSAALFAADQPDPVVIALSLASRDFFASPPTGFSEAPLWSKRGALYIAKADDQHLLSPIVARGGRLMTARQAVEMVPILRADAMAHAVLDDGVYDLDVDGIHQGYLRAARSRGALLLLKAQVTAMRRSAGKWSVTTQDGEVTARIVVNASGGWADEIGAMAGCAPIGIIPMRRTAIILDVPADCHVESWPAVAAANGSFYFKPEAGKLMASPCDETPCLPQDVQPEELDIAICIDRIISNADIDVRRPARSWAGMRSFTPDRRPVVGFDEDVEGFFWLAGQGGFGIETAPAIARVAAKLVLGNGADAYLNSLGIERQDLMPGRPSLRSSLHPAHEMETN
jgi:D-arginine dehydrogenase